MVLLALCISDLVLAAYLHMRFVDVVFLEGLLIFAYGAYIASGMGNPRSADIRTTIADPEFYREWLEDQRSKQITEGAIMMIVGTALMISAVVIGLFVIS